MDLYNITKFPCKPLKAEDYVPVQVLALKEHYKTILRKAIEKVNYNIFNFYRLIEIK